MGSVAEKNGSWEPGLLLVVGMSDQKNYGVFEAIPCEVTKPTPSA
ncbi:hypothetical protein PL8927_270260 [Planktothrix serta PCC 8927]|uniref:Uncharacterized protein n=1 Tax=Planktothrix serta PCC 8927 TaxID=671068 RepID=A0A7Z9BHV2_9CYAN|nr:hypothetical protein [Planktothrix serta]VXD14107.1 hypothetical protein PL8927_270260 [Planktothrix serta PCC 8927]